MADDWRETWRALSPLLDQALDLDGEARERWLAGLRADDPTRERAVRALLAEDERLEAGGFFALAPHAGGVGPVPSLAGQQFGAWVLERVLGQGGMGTVWLARRGDGRYEGLAAVKLLNLALLDGTGEARFRREGSLLARLSHPNIARLLDAGVTAAGQPYLVLEYVAGERIDRWCDARGLDVRARLRLVRQVLDAVAHAHAHLVVHRDLKPSNVLVTAEGTVKLLDFGIGRLAAGDETSEHTGGALTPDFASPEQVEGAPATAASDVYSLGVLLYVLLTGRHPTGADEPSPAARLRAVVEREPSPPGDVVTAPRHLRRQLRGDLGTILLKALRKAPAERYAAVAALADDVDRYLRHEPVRARPTSLGYRARKFARRHRAGVAAAAVVLGSLVTATVVTRRQLVVAREQRDVARHAVRRAEAANEFQSLLMTQGGPGERPLGMAEILARGRAAIDRRFARDPVVRVEMLIDLAGRYLELDDRDAEARTLADAVRLAAAIPDSALLAEGECAYARNLAQRGAHDSALVGMRRASATLAGVHDPAVSLRADCLGAESVVQRWAGSRDSAVTLLRGAVALLDSAGAAPDTRYGGLLNDLALHLAAAGRAREAIPVQRRTLAILDSLGLGSGQQHAVVVFNLAASLRDLGELVDARDVLRAELGRDPGAPTMLALLYGTTASALAMDDTAAAWLRRAMRDTTLRSAAVAAQLPAALAIVRLRQGRLDEARALARQALAAYRAVPDRPPSQSGRVMLQARLRRAEGGAVAGTRAALDGLRADLRWMGYGEQKGGLAMYNALVLAAEYALTLGGPAALADAERFARSAHAIAAGDSAAVGRSALVGETSLLLARVQRARGDEAGAMPWAERAVPPLTHGYGPAHPKTLDARALLDTLRRHARVARAGG